MAIKELVELVSRVTELERRASGMLRHGRVAEVDTEKHRVRLDFGPAHGAGGRFLSPWVPYAQFAGALKVHTPPSVGQQLTTVSPTGDFQQAVAVPLTWSGANPSPSTAGDQNIITYGNVTLTLMDDLTKIDVGGAIIEVTSDHILLSVQGSTIELDEAGIRLNAVRVDIN